MGGFGGGPFGGIPFGGAPAPPGTSTDYIFRDSFPYQQIAQRRSALSRQSSVVFAPNPFPVQPFLDFVFTDRHPYRNIAQRRAATALQSSVSDASWFQNFIVLPSQDYVFSDSYPYRKISENRAARSRVSAVFSLGAPVVALPVDDYIFYDSFPYRQIAEQRAQREAIKRNFTVGGDLEAFLVAPRFNSPFQDTFQYNQIRLRAALDRASRNWFATDAQTIPTPAVPSQDYIFYDANPYAQQGTIRLAQDRSRRSYIADASWYQNFIFTVPSMGFLFTDRHPYRQLAQARAARWDRNYIANGWITFAAGFPAISTDFIFYDRFNYNQMRELARQYRFNRNYIAEAPPQANIVQPFVSPGSYQPVIVAKTKPVASMPSAVFIGLPADVSDQVLPLSWAPVTIQTDQRLQGYYRWFAQTRPDIQPVIPAFPIPGIPFVDPKFNVGHVLNVCQNNRTFPATKYYAGFICEDPRTLFMTANTQVLCKTFDKDPQAITDYSIDWSAPLAAGSDTIASSNWTAPGLTIVSQTFTGAVATVFLGGGVDQTNYSVTNSIVSAGRGVTLAQNIIIAVKLR